MANAFTYYLRERRESGADDRHRWYSKVFESGRVTRGPGCRRTSVANAVDDGIALGRHLLRVR